MRTGASDGFQKGKGKVDAEEEKDKKGKRRIRSGKSCRKRGNRRGERKEHREKEIEEGKGNRSREEKKEKKGKKSRRRGKSRRMKRTEDPKHLWGAPRSFFFFLFPLSKASFMPSGKEPPLPGGWWGERGQSTL